MANVVHPITRPLYNFRTQGGGVVVWEHNRDDEYGGFSDWGKWSCGGCDAYSANRAQRFEANEHAAGCFAIPEEREMPETTRTHP